MPRRHDDEKRRSKMKILYRGLLHRMDQMPCGTTDHGDLKYKKMRSNA